MATERNSAVTQTEDDIKKWKKKYYQLSEVFAFAFGALLDKVLS
jgi:hypothetical protein